MQDILVEFVSLSSWPSPTLSLPKTSRISSSSSSHSVGNRQMVICLVSILCLRHNIRDSFIFVWREF